MQTGTPPANPFDHAFEMLGRVPQTTTEEVNEEALEKLTQALTSRGRERGRMILLRSPRAGFGKTHLLMRLHQRVAHTHEFIPLEPTKGKELDAQSVLDAVLRRFSRILPAGGGLTILDLLARRILASGLEPLVKSGEVPSQDRETALQALQVRPVETFDFHNEEAVTAQWAMANFALLGPRLTAELAERTHSGFRPVAWWVELLFRYSSAPVDQTTRNSSLFETVFSGEVVETDMHEKLVALLNLTGLVTSPVLILDEVEGFSSNPEAALQVATFLNALHQSCEKLALVISVNGDVWETAFLPRIPCGLKDRLSDIVVDLKPMEKGTAMKMLRDRAGDMAESIAEELDFDSGVVYARGVIRCAANVWPEVATYEDAGASLAPETGPISLAQEDPAPAPELEPETVPADLHPPVVVLPEHGEPVPEPVPEPVATDPTEGFLPEAQPAAAQAEPAQPADPAQVAEPDYSSQPRPFAQQQPQHSEQPQQPQHSEQPQQPQHSEQPQQPQHSEQPQQQEAPRSGEAAVPAPSPFAAVVPDAPGPSRPQAGPRPSGPLEVPPQSVTGSPFSIDTSAPAQSPFQPADPESPFQPVTPPPAQQDGPVGQAPAPHSVTDDDHEKVEDLLRQFRDRYGRD